MKKTRVGLIFFLGILLGLLLQQVVSRYQEIKSPIMQEHALDVNALIDSIGDVVHPEKFVSVSDKYRRFEEVSAILDFAYYDTGKIDSGHMMEDALKAYVNGVEDPYTVYMDAVTQSGFEEGLKGEEDFEGIGAVVKKKDYYVLIEEVLKESPAFKAGLKPLDRIITVDSGSVKDLDINEAVSKIKGPKGTKVALGIERVDRKDADKKEYLVITVTRDKLIIPSVRTKVMTTESGKNVGYIDIALIGEETETILKREIQDLKSQDIQGVILDLRGNGGGYLSVGVQVASHFIPRGKRVVTAKYRIWETEEFDSMGYGTLEDLPIVVLIDDMTASAGEIIAMALQEQIGAKLIGITSFGKGTIQTMDVFNDGASIKYTVGKWFAPSGKNIDAVGVAPDIEVELDYDLYVEQEVDTQLDKALDTVSTLIN